MISKFIPALRSLSIERERRGFLWFLSVIKIIHQRSNDQPWYIPKGVCNSIVDTVISPSHAIKCDGKWIDVRNIGQREDKPRNVEYINLQTNNYCNDELILESGLVIESWDGMNGDLKTVNGSIIIN